MSLRPLIRRLEALERAINDPPPITLEGLVLASQGNERALEIVRLNPNARLCHLVCSSLPLEF